MAARASSTSVFFFVTSAGRLFRVCVETISDLHAVLIAYDRKRRDIYRADARARTRKHAAGNDGDDCVRRRCCDRER